MRLSELEPDLSGTEAELEFVKEIVIPSVDEVIKEGTEETLKLCLEFLKLDDKIKGTTKDKQAIYEKLLLHLGAGSNVCMYDDQQLFTYKSDKRGVCKLLVNHDLKMIYSDQI